MTSKDKEYYIVWDAETMANLIKMYSGGFTKITILPIKNASMGMIEQDKKVMGIAVVE